ncbi:MFS general substrate transporter [Crucibulum laeve]|uniref:MFS general substrate transporter n=1 Tax=Crucibulum laeve TaxID=68775 RepID=A0A5C3LIH6_9AGAR|nr:MFS general substrate transporter [Crucibulum laeve]
MSSDREPAACIILPKYLNIEDLSCTLEVDKKFPPLYELPTVHKMASTPSISETSPPTPDVSTIPDPERTVKKKRSQMELTDQTNLLPFRKIIIAFLGLAMCMVVSTLDSVVVATAIPTISAAFNAGSVVSWVPSGYLLTSTSFQPLYGRLSDIFGRKAALCVAMGVFMVGNLLAGFSKTIVQLIVFRGIAGAGGGGIISMSQIVISDIVSLRDRGKYQGLIGGVVAFGYAVGPLIGGALAQKVSWRWCFWISVPTSLIAIVVVMFVLPLKRVEGDIRRKLLAIDYLGAGLTLGGCTLIILPLIWGGVTFPWKSAVVLAPLFSGFLVVMLFCFWEWKGARLPIVPMYIFKHMTVSGVYITMFINGFVYFASLYYLPQYFQTVLGYDPIRASVFLVPLLVVQIFTSWVAGVIVSRTGRYKTIIHLGFAVWSIACGLISTINPHTKKALLVIYMMLAGIGAGQTFQTTTIAAQASVSRKDMSVVTAFRNFIRLLGGSLSLAIGATIINNSLRASMTSLSLTSSTISSIIDDPSKLSSPSSIGISQDTATEILLSGYTKGFKSLFVLNASLNAVATIASVVMIRHKDLSRDDKKKEEVEKAVEGQAEGNEKSHLEKEKEGV